MLKPINKRVLVRPDKVKTMSDGGIHLAPSAQDRPLEGVVVARADNCEIVGEDIVGKHVMYGKFVGTEVEDTDKDGDKETFILIKEVDLVAEVTK